MPSTETQGQQPGERTGGVGSLPGPKDEQGVAVLPEERTTETTETLRPEHRQERPGDSTNITKDTGATGVGVSGATDLLKKDTQSRVSSDPRVRGQVYACRSRKGVQRSGHLGDPTIQLEPRVYPLGGDSSRWHGVDFGRRGMEEWERAAALTNVPTPLSPGYFLIFLSCILIRFLPKDPPTETGVITPEQKTASSEPRGVGWTVHESDNLGGTQRSASSEGGVEGQHKASLKEKIAGGMKVVSGKLSRDESKVEEGKKLMHGQSA